MGRLNTMQSRVWVLLAVFSAFGGSSVAWAETGAQKFYKAFYLEQQTRDWTAACKLYEESAGDSSLESSLKPEVQARLATCKEELASTDFANLMPPDVMVYVEFKQPGDQLLRLIDQLGLLGAESGGPKDKAVAQAGRFLAVSPKLIREMLGVRGMAVAITGFNPMKMMPTGVLVIHPGDVDALRGMLETGLPAGAAPAESIQGFNTYLVENQAIVTLTRRLVVVGLDRASIEGVLKRLRGEETKSLATNARAAEALKGRGDSLMYFLVDAKSMMPYVSGVAAMAGGASRQVAMANAVLDPNSVQSVVGKLGVNDAGPFLTMSLRLDKGHHNLVYNFLRTAPINRDTFKAIPEGAAGFLVGAINDASSRHSASPGGKSEGAPVVTALDFGRELFANITSFAVFAIPPTDAGESKPADESKSAGAPPIPDIALVITVNDPSKSDALWRQVLGIASMAGGGAATLDGTVVKVEGVDVRSFKMPEGVMIHFATLENDVMITPSKAALASSIRAKRSNKSVLNDPVFAASLSRVSPESTKALFLHPARLARVASAIPDARDGLKEIEPFLPMLSNTVASAVVEHSGDLLAFSTALTGVPNVGSLVAQMMNQDQNGRESQRKVEQALKGNKLDDALVAANAQLGQSPGDAKMLRAKFEILAKKQDQDAARPVAEALVKALADDAKALNNFAWELLTEKSLAGHYVDIALRAALRANEMTGHKSWIFLDTLALARFESGDVGAAVKLQKQAIELAGDKSKDELQGRLARFEAAAKTKSGNGTE